MRDVSSLLHNKFRYAQSMHDSECHCREEGNEQIKLEIARCIGAWCASADAMSAEAQRQFERGLSEKDSLLQAHLRSLVQVTGLCPPETLNQTGHVCC